MRRGSKKKKKLLNTPPEEGAMHGSAGVFISHLKLRRHLGKEEKRE